MEIIFPKRNTKFTLSDFFQIEVDDFRNGEFLFLSAKEVLTKTDRKLYDLIDSIDDYGWIISTYCYNYKSYFKIFVCEYKQKPWQNHYHIEYKISDLNGTDGLTVNSSIKEFSDWINESIENKLIKPL